MFDLSAILEAGVAAGRAPGFSAAVLTPGGARLTACAGRRGAEDETPVTPDTLFWIASCSKAITSVALLQLVEQGLVDLDAPVSERLPVLANPQVLSGFDDDGAPILRPARTAITARHLLTHTSGLAYDFACAELGRYLTATGKSLMGGQGDPDIPLMFDPGEAWLYGIGIDWAGRLVEAVTGEGLDTYCAKQIFTPLGMTDTTYFPDAEQASRKASVSQKVADGAFIPIPFGMPDTPHFMMGGGGLYATAGDYLTFLAAIASGGAPLLRPDTVGAMLTNQVGDLDAGALKSAQPLLSHDFTPLPGVTKRWGLAGLINSDPVPGGRAAGSLGWAGLANAYYWVDPTNGAAGVLLAQIFPFADPGVVATFEEIERGVYA